jgi:hypothetical protein
MRPISRGEVIRALATAGYSANPKGIVSPFPPDFSEARDQAWIDVNADAIRKGDVVPDRPIRITYQCVSGIWQLKSVAELRPGDQTKALDRLPETLKISPWPTKTTNK